MPFLGFVMHWLIYSKTAFHLTWPSFSYIHKYTTTPYKMIGKVVKKLTAEKINSISSVCSLSVY